MSELQIVMYHYVRDLRNTRYPEIKARQLSEFQAQLEYIGENFNVVTVEQIVAAIKGEAPLPSKAAWLTFDDGYLDHYTNVFPLLLAKGWQGSFFPPVNTVVHRELLDVNKIHFILAAQTDTRPILDEIRRFVDQRNDGKKIMPFDSYWQNLARPSRFDPADVTFIKKILQRDLPEASRNELTNQLFEMFVGVQPATFAAELYVSADQLQAMIHCGMYVGSHGARHNWLDRLSLAEQTAEIDASLEFLDALGAPTTDWVMCYPYGAYNSDTLKILEDRDCAAGLTTKVSNAQIGQDKPLELPRLNTNDLPISFATGARGIKAAIA